MLFAWRGHPQASAMLTEPRTLGTNPLADRMSVTQLSPQRLYKVPGEAAGLLATNRWSNVSDITCSEVVSLTPLEGSQAASG